MGCGISWVYTLSLIMPVADDRVRVPPKQDITMACIIYTPSGALLGQLSSGVPQRAKKYTTFSSLVWASIPDQQEQVEHPTFNPPSNSN